MKRKICIFALLFIMILSVCSCSDSQSSGNKSSSHSEKKVSFSTENKKQEYAEPEGSDDNEKEDRNSDVAETVKEETEQKSENFSDIKDILGLDEDVIYKYKDVVKAFCREYGVPKLNEYGNFDIESTYCNLIDFNNDGRQELVLASNNGILQIYAVCGSDKKVKLVKEIQDYSCLNVDIFYRIIHDTSDDKYYFYGDTFVLFGHSCITEEFDGKKFVNHFKGLWVFDENNDSFIKDDYLDYVLLDDDFLSYYSDRFETKDDSIVFYDMLYPDAYGVSDKTIRKILEIGKKDRIADYIYD